MKKHASFILALALSLTVATNTAHARPRLVKCTPTGQGAAVKAQLVKFFEVAPTGELQLTEDQKTEIALILKKYQPDLTAAISGLTTTAATLSTAVHSSTFDEQAIRTAHQAAAAQSEELAVLRGHIISEVKAILTPAQQEKLDSSKAAIKAALKEAKQGIQKRIQNWIKSHS